MRKRRVHSLIDTLPPSVRKTLAAMVVDGTWPEGLNVGSTGKPTYDDLAEYCRRQGYVVSRSANGRWAKGLLAYERMRSAARIARQVMGDLTAETATETQKAAAEIMTAQIIEMISDADLTPKEIAMTSAAIRDCTQVALKADQYIRAQAVKKAEAAVKEVSTTLRKKKIDPETLRVIREQIYGIIK